MFEFRCITGSKLWCFKCILREALTVVKQFCELAPLPLLHCFKASLCIRFVPKYYKSLLNMDPNHSPQRLNAFRQTCPYTFQLFASEFPAGWLEVDFVQEWEGWTELQSIIVGCGWHDDEEAYLGEIVEASSSTTERLTELIEKNRDVEIVDDDTRLEQLAQAPFYLTQGKASGDRCNCLIDSLLQLLMTHGFIEYVEENAFRKRIRDYTRKCLTEHADESLRPVHRNSLNSTIQNSVKGADPFLEHNKHAAAIINIIFEFYRTEANVHLRMNMPQDGFLLTFFSRIDCAERPPDRLHVRGSTLSQVNACEMYLYVATGERLTGYHYTPMRKMSVCPPPLGDPEALPQDARAKKSGNSAASNSSSSGVARNVGSFGIANRKNTVVGKDHRSEEKK